MVIPISDGIGKARWVQGDDEETGVEIRIPITMPDGARPRELSVEIKDETVLCISYKETRIVQWRLYAAVKDEVEWRVEDESVLVLDLEKKIGAPWSCLVDLPISDKDDLLTSIDEINQMFKQQLPVLPSPNDVAKEELTARGKTENTEEEDTLEKLLDEAAEEVVRKDITSDETEEGQSTFVKAELDNYRVEEEEITKKLAEIELLLANPTDTDATNTAVEQRNILQEMIRLHNECRVLRSEPSTLESFILCTQLDLQKARVNVGEMGEKEVEEYESEDERSLNATELMTCGLKFFEDQDIKGCLHFLRLAAIHHKHDQSILLLYNIYSQLQSPRGAFLLLQRALDDENPSAGANQKLGELYDQGARHFLPLFPASLYFYQRAAKLGSVNAMLSLAQLWLRGATGSSMLSEEQMEGQRSVSKYHAWLKKAMDRGCGSAYFVRGCMHLKGEHGMAKSYKDAKECLDAAGGAQPEILRRAPQIMMMLEMLRKEEADSNDTPSATKASSASTEAKQSAVVASANSGDVKVKASTGYLNSLGSTKGSMVSNGGRGATGSSVSRAKKGFGASARVKAFWERACVTGVSVYALYTLAFPLRVMILPLFYTAIGGVLESIPWLGNPNADASVF